MSNTTDILRLEFELIRQDLIDKHIELGMKASGDWINSLEVQAEGLTARIMGNDYTEQLVNGRPNGRFPPVSLIEKWINDKGIKPYDNISVSSLAFLIARKISREGTKYYQQGGTDLIEAVITPERIQRIIDNVSEFYISTIVSDITGIFKSVAA